MILPYLQSFVLQGIDPFYEYHRHFQHNPDDPRINDIQPFGSTFIDFSQDWRVALFFANAKRGQDDEGGMVFLPLNGKRWLIY